MADRYRMAPGGTVEWLDRDVEEIEEDETRDERGESTELDQRDVDYRIRIDGVGMFSHDVIGEFEHGSDMFTKLQGRSDGFQLEAGLCCYVNGTVTVAPEEDVCEKVARVAHDLAAQLSVTSWWYNAGLDELSHAVYRHAQEHLQGFRPTGWQVYEAGGLMGSQHRSPHEEGTY